MIKFARSLITSRKLTVAVSGGVDSMAALDFLRRKHQVQAAVFDHGDEFHSQAVEIIDRYCVKHKIPVLHSGPAAVLHAHAHPSTRTHAQEHEWRAQRYAWLDSLNTAVVLAHTLDDVVETWVWSSCHGCPKTIPWTRQGAGSVYIRPFLLTRKADFVDWCQRHEVEWIDDPSNFDTSRMRGLLRSGVLDEILKINPGIHKTLSKILTRKLAPLQGVTCTHELDRLADLDNSTCSDLSILLD